MNKVYFLFLLFLETMVGYGQDRGEYVDRFTGNNPVALTDVVYCGSQDSILVSKLNGQVVKIHRLGSAPQVLVDVQDEIFAMAYHQRRRELVIATMHKGIMVVDSRGKILKQILQQDSWSTHLHHNSSFDFIITTDQKGRRYILDVAQGYQMRAADSSIPGGRIVDVDEGGNLLIIQAKKTIRWSFSERKAVWVAEIPSFRYADEDGQGNFLSIAHNTGKLLEGNTGQIKYELKHPNWPLPDLEREGVVHQIPYSMQINTAKILGKYIFTGGIDRTVRVWDKETGKLLKTIDAHKGSVVKILKSPNGLQVVSIDIKGGIHFEAVPIENVQLY